jgi:hypothetical protein
LEQPLADLARRYADNGIFPGIVSRGAREKFYADQSLFKSVKISSKRLLDDVDEKLAATLAIAECTAFSDFLDAMKKAVCIVLRPTNSNRFLSGTRRCL